jgi:hypothetical protein
VVGKIRWQLGKAGKYVGLGLVSGTVPHHFVHDPTSCTLFQIPSVAYFLLLLNHIDVCKFNSLIQYSEVVLKLSNSNEIYRDRTKGLV